MIALIGCLLFVNLVICQHHAGTEVNYHDDKLSNTHRIQDGGHGQYSQETNENQPSYNNYNQRNNNQEQNNLNVDHSAQGKVSHITIIKEVPIPQPVHIPVEVERVIPFPVHVRIPVLVDRPYHVKIYRPYTVPVYKDIPYPIYRDVPIPVKVPVEVPYPVKVPVLVPVPFRIEIDEPIKVQIPEVRIIKKGVVLEHQERINGGENVIGHETSIEAGSSNGLDNHDLKASDSDLLEVKSRSENDNKNS